MWFQEHGASRAFASSAWWLSETMLIEPWRLGLVAIAGLARWLYRSRGPYHVPPMSDEWLRRQEIDSGKHHDGI